MQIKRHGFELTDLNKAINILLVLLLSGVPTLAAKNVSDVQCCHSKNKAPEKKHSCCEMPEEKPAEECNMFKINPSSFDHCGCIHEYNTLDQTVLNRLDTDLSRVLAELTFDNSAEINTSIQTELYITKIPYNYKVPIYISISSYLI